MWAPTGHLVRSSTDLRSGTHLGVIDGTCCYSERGEVIEVKVIGYRIKECGHGKCQQRNPNRLGQDGKFPQRRHVGAAVTDSRSAADTAGEQEEEKSKAEPSQIHGVFEVHVVDRLPRRPSQLAECENFHTESIAGERVA